MKQKKTKDVNVIEGKDTRTVIITPERLIKQNNFIGSIDSFWDKDNNLGVVLVENNGVLLAYKSNISDIPKFREFAEEIELMGNGMNNPIAIKDSDVDIIAKFGEKIDLKTAKTYFPKLKDKTYLQKIGLISFDGKNLTK